MSLGVENLCLSKEDKFLYILDLRYKRRCHVPNEELLKSTKG
jgi:hypothetical protein